MSETPIDAAVARLTNDAAACEWVTTAVHYYADDKDQLAKDIRLVLKELAHLREGNIALHRELNDLWDHVVDQGMMSPDDDSDGVNAILEALDKYNPNNAQDT